MMNIKNQKGAITLLVLVSMLFFVTFLASTYMILSNKAQTQIEMTKQTKATYNSVNATDLYKSYFGDTVIPIYTVEQLLNIGTDQNIVVNEIGGKIFTFSKTATYTLMNDLEFDVNDWADILGETLEWIPVESIQDFTGNFEGNGHKIKVININNYEIVYPNLNGYAYQEFTFTIIPSPVTASVIINEQAISTITVNEGTAITWEVSNTGYITQENIEGIIVDSNTELNVTLIAE